MYTLLGADVTSLGESRATVVLEVLEHETERVEPVTVTVGAFGLIEHIGSVTFAGAELEGFVRSVHLSTCKRIEHARREVAR